MSDPVMCELCGEPMTAGEEMFKYHGYSGPCPKPPLAAPAPTAGGDRPTSADDVLFMLGESASKATGEPTRQMAEEIWALMDGETLFSLAVRAWERGNAVVAARALTSSPGDGTRCVVCADTALPCMQGHAGRLLTSSPVDGPADLMAYLEREITALLPRDASAYAAGFDAGMAWLLDRVKERTPAAPSPLAQPQQGEPDGNEIDGHVSTEGSGGRADLRAQGARPSGTGYCPAVGRQSEGVRVPGTEGAGSLQPSCSDGAMAHAEVSGLAPSPLAPVDPECEWLIERDFGGELHYWTGRPFGGTWSVAVNDARLFSRRIDASCMLTWHCQDIGRVITVDDALTAAPAPAIRGDRDV